MVKNRSLGVVARVESNMYLRDVEAFLPGCTQPYLKKLSCFFSGYFVMDCYVIGPRESLNIMHSRTV